MEMVMMVEVVAEIEVEVEVMAVEEQVITEVLMTNVSLYLAPGTVLISTSWPLSQLIIPAAVVISILHKKPAL